MGFYAPAQIVGDARKNGVEVREIDVSFSHAQNTLEEQSGNYHALRLGFRQIDGFKWTDPDEEFLRQQKRQAESRGLGRAHRRRADAPSLYTRWRILPATPRCRSAR